MILKGVSIHHLLQGQQLICCIALAQKKEVRPEDCRKNAS